MMYLGIDSFLKRLSAISKFSELFAIAFLAYFITNPVHQLILFIILTAVILGLGKIPVKDYLKALRVFFTFGFVLLVMQVLLYGGGDNTMLFQIGKFGIRRQAFIYGVNLGFRVWNIGSSVLSFIMTTEPRRMIYDMVEKLHIPYRFAYGFYSALRFIPIFEEEARNILNAHAIRGTNTVEKGLKSKIRVFTRLGAPLLVSGLRKAKTSAIAMDARAFGAYPKRTQTVTYDSSWKDYVFGIVPWIITILYLVWLIVNHNLGFLKT